METLREAEEERLRRGIAKVDCKLCNNDARENAQRRVPLMRRGVDRECQVQWEVQTPLSPPPPPLSTCFVVGLLTLRSVL